MLKRGAIPSSTNEPAHSRSATGIGLEPTLALKPCALYLERRHNEKVYPMPREELIKEGILSGTRSSQIGLTLRG
jgi:hypothetical protein